MEQTMKTLKALLEEVKVFNLDTDEELDLDALANLDLDDLLGFSDGDDEFGDNVDELDFNDDISSMNIDDFQLDGSEFNLGSDFGDDEFGGEFGDDEEFEFGEDSEFGDIDSFELEDNDEFDFGEDSEGDEFGDSELGMEDEEFGDEFGEEEDSDFQGDIRTVRGANLVYKRKAEDGNFEELWIYNVGKDIKHETKIRHAILAGTDIDPSAQESEDGEQRADTTTAGNVQFLHITGLPQ